MFFLHPWTYPAHPTTPFKKNVPPSCSFTYVMDFFFKTLFHFAVIITTAMVPSPVAIVDV
jgi:hypothetical protein